MNPDRHLTAADEPWPAPDPAVLPADDAFHVPPAGFAALPPGTVLRYRPVRLAAFGLVPLRLTAWQLLYRTADLHGAPEVAVTTVVAAGAPEPGRVRPLLSFQCAIDAVSSRGFPSYALRHRSRALGSFPQVEMLCFADALARGWVLSIPDHEGALGAWGAPREPGHRTLDGVRAAMAFAPLGLSTDSPVGLWGYSGGGLATAWAAELAPTYAPELTIAGAVLGSPVGDLVATFHRLNGGLHAGLPTLVVAGLRRVYPALDRVIEECFTEAGRTLLDRAAGWTTGLAVARLARYDINRHALMPLTDVLALPQIEAVFDDLRLGTQAPAAPLLVVQSVGDQIIAVADIDALVERYRDHGAAVTYLRDRLSASTSACCRSRRR
ncbi:lipase family protein [Nocardia thailandica]